MIVTIWRHGEAGSAVIDRVRELTDIGREEIRYGSRQFIQHCAALNLPHPDLLLFSEWVRTRQTADILGWEFSVVRKEPCVALIPGRSPEDVDAQLNDLLSGEATQAHILLVSHQPLVSRLVDHYLGTSGMAPPLMPGGLATLELDVAGPDCGRLLFCAQPPGYRRV